MALDERHSDVTIDEQSNTLAVGIKIPTSVKTPVSYLDGLRKYKDVYNDIYKQMEVANKLYKFDPKSQEFNLPINLPA